MPESPTEDMVVVTEDTAVDTEDTVDTVELVSAVVSPLVPVPLPPSRVEPLAWDPVVLVPATPLVLLPLLVPREYSRSSLVVSIVFERCPNWAIKRVIGVVC